MSNNAWRDGALGHSPSEGEYAARKAAAIQAYYEWLPVREPAAADRVQLFRALELGDLATLHLLDTRHYARDKALDIVDYVNPNNGAIDAPRFAADLAAPRALLGIEQQSWLLDGLGSSATWQVIGQQILAAPMYLPAPIALRQLTFAQYAALKALEAEDPGALTASQRRLLAAPAIPYNLDAWDGYPDEQRWLFDTAASLDVNLLVLAGDTHNAWANDLVSSTGAAIGAELACPSISSRGLDELLAGQDPATVAAGALAAIPRLRYAETGHRGYLTLTLTHEKASACWSYVDGVKTVEYQTLPQLEQRMCVLPGAGQRRLLPDA